MVYIADLLFPVPTFIDWACFKTTSGEYSVCYISHHDLVCVGIWTCDGLEQCHTEVLDWGLNDSYKRSSGGGCET